MNRFLWLAFVVLTHSTAILAQHEITPLKFDEFTQKSSITYYPYTEFGLTDRIERYKKELQKRPGSAPYIISYRGRIVDETTFYETERWFDTPKQELRDLRRFQDKDNVPQVFGGYREENTLEFWILPRGASAPKPTPSVDESEIIRCPDVRVFSDGFHFDQSEPVIFKAHVGSEVKVPLSYHWTVSAGEIVSGANSEATTVDAKNASGDRITASVKVDGLPAVCRSGAATTIEVGLHPYLFDSAERFNYSELSARFDAFMITLQNDPALKGYVICYSSRKGYSAGLNLALTYIRKLLRFRRFPLNKVDLIDGGSWEVGGIEMWIVPHGATPPSIHATVDTRFVKKSIKKFKGQDLR
jgi:hypothetical protein